MNHHFLRIVKPSQRRDILGIVLVAFCFSHFDASPSRAGEWQVLFDGNDLKHWEPTRGNEQFRVEAGAIVGASSAKTNFLHTKAEYRDFELELEFKLHDTDLNSGVQFRTRLTRENDQGKSRPSVHGPQVDLGKSPGRSGHVFGQGNGRWFTPEDQLVRNSHLINGEWNQIRVQAKGRNVKTWINENLVSDLTLEEEVDEKYPKGVIALQVHGVKSPEKIRHVSFRAIRVRSLEE